MKKLKKIKKEDMQNLKKESLSVENEAKKIDNKLLSKKCEVE